MVTGIMVVTDWVRRQLGTEPGYECPLCSLSFDSDQPNCPACGYSELQEA